MTFKQARSELDKIGISLSHGVDDDEFRVNFKSGREATAYYTNDLDDAIGTGRHMAAHRSKTVKDRIKTAVAVVALSVPVMAGQCWAQTVTDDPDLLFPGHPGAPGGPGGGSPGSPGAPPSVIPAPPPPGCCVFIPSPPPTGTIPPGPFEPAASPD